MSLPTHDWQFWVASAIAAVAAYFVVRMVIPPGVFSKLLGRKPKPPSHRATLTLEGRTVKKSGEAAGRGVDPR